MMLFDAFKKCDGQLSFKYEEKHMKCSEYVFTLGISFFNLSVNEKVKDRMAMVHGIQFSEEDDYGILEEKIVYDECEIGDKCAFCRRGHGGVFVAHAAGVLGDCAPDFYVTFDGVKWLFIAGATCWLLPANFDTECSSYKEFVSCFADWAAKGYAELAKEMAQEAAALGRAAGA